MTTGLKFDEGKINPLEDPNLPLIYHKLQRLIARKQNHCLYMELKWQLNRFTVIDRTIGIFEAMRVGEQKYGYGNWKLVDNGIYRYTNAAIRHDCSRRYYPDNPVWDESGLRHRYHAATSYAFAFWLVSQELGFLQAGQE